MSLDTPMSLLGKIPHNTNSEFVIWNMDRFTIIASDDGWRPPTDVLAFEKSMSERKINQNLRILKPNQYVVFPSVLINIFLKVKIG